MKITYLMLHQPYGRGSGRYLRYLFDYFKKNNKINFVCGMKTKSYPKVKIYYPKLNFQIPVYHGRADVKKNVRLSKIDDKQFYNLIDKIKNKGFEAIKNTKLMHANHCSIIPYCCSLIKQKTGIPYVITAHGTGVMSSLESKRNFKIAEEGMQNSELIISNSKFTAKHIRDNFNIERSKVKVVYLGVDTKEFKPISQENKNKVKKKYGCLGKRLVFSSGYFDRSKGFQDLIMAAKIYEKKGIVTLISGIGPHHKEISKIVKKLKLNNTRLIGFVPKKDLIALYAAADLYVFPSRWDEPFGLVAVEAMASGTPVIGTKVGGIPEIIKGNGIIVDPKKPGQIAKAILKYIFDDRWLKINSKKARKVVETKFNYKKMCKNTEKIYRQILKKC